MQNFELKYCDYTYSLPHLFSLAAQILPLFHFDRIVVQTENPVLIFIATIAAIKNNKILHFDLKKSIEVDQNSYVIDDLTSIPHQREFLAANFNLNLEDNNIPVIFSTSGSTGGSKNIEKNLHVLMLEVIYLEEFYQITQTNIRCIDSLVLPGHIYGFLHTLLLPLYADLKVSFMSGLELMQLQRDAAILVMVPSLWDVVERYLLNNQIHFMVSSGASFGFDKRKKIATYRNKINSAIEILGSTETGGIGFSNLFDQKNIFELFSGVDIFQKNGQNFIKSPYILKHDNVDALHDQVRLLPHRCFEHLGRLDHIFKHSGKRYSLQEVEEKIKSLNSHWQVKCAYVEDTSSSKGGALHVWIVGHIQDTESTARSLRECIEPTPSKINFLTKFPLDSNGKVSIDSLLKACLK